MTKAEVYGDVLNRQLTTTNTTLEVLRNLDYGKLGVFALVARKFNIIKGRVNRFYNLEVYEYDHTGKPILSEIFRFKNKRDLIKGFNRIKERLVVC